MSRIDDLIQEYCPSGVEFRELGNVAKVTIGEFVHKNKQNPTAQYPVYNGGRTETGYYDRYNNTGNKVVISARGAYAGYVNRVDNPYWAGNSSYSVSFDDEKIDWLFGYHILKASEERLKGGQQKGGIPAVSKSQVEKFKIPIPPLEIQREIVDILDKFTQLEAELEAELEARKKQYEYYRNQLLTFDDAGGVRWTTLGELAMYSKARIEAARLDHENYVGVDNILQNRQGKTASSYVPTIGNLTQFDDGDILIGNIRPYLKKIWHADKTGGTNGDVLVIKLTDKNVTPRYIYQVLASDAFFDYEMKHAKGAKMPRGDKASIMKYPVAVPSIPEQDRIVGILDKFDKLVNNISEGLPAELKARRQQYEYYRNKLLTFQELPA